MVMGELHGKFNGEPLRLDRRLTHDQLAVIVGSTRQWVTATLARLKKRGEISFESRTIVIDQPEVLRSLAGDPPERDASLSAKAAGFA